MRSVIAVTKMHILCVTPMYPEAGHPAFGVFVKALNLQVARQGHTVEVLHRAEGKRGIASYLGLLVAGLRQATKRPKPDIVHGHYLGPAAAIACLLGWLMRRPVVLTAHGSDIEAARHPIVRVAWRVVLAYCEGLHLVSRALTERARELIGRLPPAVLVQPVGVDVQLYAPRHVARPTLGSAASPLPLHLLVVARLSPEKGWSDALAALSLLRRPGRDVVLTACGDGDRAWFSRQLAEHGVTTNVEVLGFRPPEALPDLYANADIVLVPSWREGFGLAGLEAMAVGAPVVSTAAGGLADYVRDQVNALVVPIHDPEAFARAIMRLAGDAGLRARLRQNGIKTARLYSMTEAAHALVGFYEQCAARHATR